MPIDQGTIFECTSESCPALFEIINACTCETACEISCCGTPMKQLQEKTADAATEKHVPVIEKVDGGYKVTVGSVPHPMLEEHWIQWIELTLGDLVQRCYLSPGDAPSATFLVNECCQGKCGAPSAREHCNVHGLWKA